MPECTYKRSEAKRGCLIRGETFDLIRDEDDTHQRCKKSKESNKTLVRNGLRAGIFKYGHGKCADAARIVDRRGGKTEKRLHPEGNFAQRKPAVLGEFQRKARAEEFEVIARPVGGYGTGMVKIEGLDRTGAEGVDRSFAILARHLA